LPGNLWRPTEKLLFFNKLLETGYSMGFNIEQRNGHLIVSHGGAQRRTRTLLLCAPNESLTVALMCNTEGSNLMDLGHGVLKVLLNED
jgi:hypothetical protein